MSAKAGLISGGVATIICNPLDIIRINIQANNMTNLESISFIYKKNGLLGFFRGVSIGLITIPTFWGIYFPCYNNIKKITDIQSIAAYIACNIASTFTSPLWYIRQKYYTFTPFNLIQELKNKNIKQFYSGLSSTYIINSNFIFQIPTYEFLKTRLDSNNTSHVFLATATSKTFATLITYPLENIRVISRKFPNNTIVDSIRHVIKYKSYYNGLSAYLIRSIPYHGAIFCTYEYLVSKK
jgi:solute carrier family 25 folate transporter 32